MKKYLLLTLFLFSFSSIFSQQKEANIWYFGSEAGIDFNPTIPVPLVDGVINTIEGCASIADSNGDLLFYTDGISVWNKNHVQMPNGFGLFGNSSSTQSGVIVPQPGNDSIYYVFTVAPTAGANGFRYSRVNMNLDSGLGDVETSSKNTPVLTPTCEKIVAAANGSNANIWVVTHHWGTADFYAYEVTPTGFVNTPVISTIGAVHTGGVANTLGHLKISSDGSKIAYCSYTMTVNQVFDFNNTTGVVSNSITLPFSGNQYGCEFSPDVSKLYYSSFSNSTLYQYDLSSNDSATIVTSEELISTSSVQLGALQLAPDNRIYAARFSQPDLGVINDPNIAGTGCNYVDVGFNLGGKTSNAGLPNFIISFLNQPTASFNSMNYCLNDTTCFWYTGAEGEYDSLVWYFDDPSTGPLDTAYTDSACHFYANAGSYDVTLIVYDSIFSDTSIQNITIYQTPIANVGNDTLLCNGQLTIGTNNQGSTFAWNTGDTTQTITIDTSGTYFVHVMNGSCEDFDTINVIYTQPYLDIGPDTLLCQGETINLSADAANSYFWNTTATTQSISVNQTGEYYVVVADTNGCQDSDTLNVAYSILDVELGPDQFKCTGESVLLDAGSSATTYQWSSGETTQQNYVGTPGIYIVEITDGGRCTDADTISIFKGETPFVQIEQEQGVCKELILSVPDKEGQTFSWSTGETENTIIVTEDGNYSITVDNGECPNVDTVSVEVEYVEPETIIPNVFTPNSDNFNDELVFKLPEVESYDLKIFNRWGRLVFETPDNLNHWDGNDYEQGVYSYVLVYTKLCGQKETITETGYVTLLR